MTSAIQFGSRRVSAALVLMILAGMAVAAALLTPEQTSAGGGLSSYSTGPGGARIAHDLARRMGWRVSRREAPLDSSASRAVHVVIGPRDALGAHEVHRLLENVRRGGGLVFSIDAASEIADSLGLGLRSRTRFLQIDRGDCDDRSTSEERGTFLPPTVREIRWRRPPPGPVRPIVTGYGARSGPATVGVGFTMGLGRVAAVSTSDVFANEAVRTCPWHADVAVARAFEYVGEGTSDLPLVFDEYHHGYGVHGGSFTAVARFLSRTASGRFIAQALVAGLLLLFAFAPRPVIPSEASRIVRRSPLEHASALGRAYADVGATKTATARLVSGLRRRAGRTVAVNATADDDAFLAGVAMRVPATGAEVAAVRRALTEPTPLRDFPTVGAAVESIERALLTPPSPRS